MSAAAGRRWIHQHPVLFVQGRLDALNPRHRSRRRTRPPPGAARAAILDWLLISLWKSRRMAASSLSASSGWSFRYCLAASRPWPSAYRPC